MGDWQINAVNFIDLINGHSRGQKFANQGVIPFTHFLRFHQTKLGLRSAHARLC